MDCIYANKGCLVKIPFKLMEDHLNGSNCKYPTRKCTLCFKRIEKTSVMFELNHHEQNECEMYVLECMYCKEKNFRKDFNEHGGICEKRPKKCPYNNIFGGDDGDDKCDFLGDDDQLKIHLEEKNNNLKHVSMIANTLNIRLMNEIKKGTKDMSVRCVFLEDRLLRKMHQIEAMINNDIISINDEYTTKNRQDIIRNLLDESVDIEDFKRIIITLQRQEGQRETSSVTTTAVKIPLVEAAAATAISETETITTSQPLSITNNNNSNNDNNIIISQIKNHERKLIEMDYRFSSEKITYENILIWKISDYRQLKAESKSKQSCAMYSPPLYIPDKFGYKTFLKIYLNGTGGGKNTHFSIYFAIMKGEYDELLQWPFDRNVEITIRTIKPAVFTDCKQVIVPDVTKFENWGKPRRTFNAATGWSKFITHRTLETEDFLSPEDCIYIQLMTTAKVNVRG